MAGRDLAIIMAAGTNFCDVLGIADFMQSCGNVIVVPEDKLIRFMAYPAAADGCL